MKNLKDSDLYYILIMATFVVLLLTFWAQLLSGTKSLPGVNHRQPDTTINNYFELPDSYKDNSCDRYNNNEPYIMLL